MVCKVLFLQGMGLCAWRCSAQGGRQSSPLVLTHGRSNQGWTSPNMSHRCRASGCMPKETPPWPVSPAAHFTSHGGRLSTAPCSRADNGWSPLPFISDNGCSKQIINTNSVAMYGIFLCSLEGCGLDLKAAFLLTAMPNAGSAAAPCQLLLGHVLACCSDVSEKTEP